MEYYYYKILEIILNYSVAIDAFMHLYINVFCSDYYNLRMYRMMDIT